MNSKEIHDAEVRGEEKLASWTRDGRLIPLVTFAKAWGVASEAVEAARGRGEVFALYVAGRHWYPSEMLKFDPTTLASVVKALGQLPPSGKVLFFLKRHGALGQSTPAEAVRHGMLPDVLRAATSSDGP